MPRKSSNPRVSHGWSKTKQIARKCVKTPAERRREIIDDERAKKAQEKFIHRELAKAAKILARDGPVEKRQTRSVKCEI
jgi:hypothetical protein